MGGVRNRFRRPGRPRHLLREVTGALAHSRHIMTQRGKSGLDRIDSSVRYVKSISGVGVVVTDSVRGLLAGTLVAAFLALVDHLATFGSAIALLPLLLIGAIAGAVLGFRRRPDSLRAARTLDHGFSLADRSTTALELRDSTLPVAELQRQDAAKHVEGLNLSRTARTSFRLREAVGVPFALAIFLALALTVPAAAHTAHSHGSQDVKRIQNVVHKQLPPVIKSAKTLAEQHHQNATLRAIYRQLRKLQRQLQHSHTRADALKK